MSEAKNTVHKHKKKKSKKKILGILILDVIIIALGIGVYRFYTDYIAGGKEFKFLQRETRPEGEDKLTPREMAALEEQERLKKEVEDRQELIIKADRLALGYDYEGAIDLIKKYNGSEGGYQVYTSLVTAIERLETEQKALLLYGGTYDSVTQVNHIFFQPLIADKARAFDEEPTTKDYNKYMVTIKEFQRMLEKLYADGYVLIRMSDLVKKITLEDGTTKYTGNEIYLKEGKKPLIISEDDVNYYEYMLEDGFASRLVLDEEGKVTCEMLQEDGTTVTGAYDIIPILDAFVKEHPDFSYKGAKGLLTVTGYEGTFGYRTNDPESETYDEDRVTVKSIAEVLKAEGWEFGCHSWGHKNVQTATLEFLQRDTERWFNEVGYLVGPTDIYAFPFGIDIETGVGTYDSDKYLFLKESGFNIFLGAYKERWMHLKKDYVRMTRRTIDGQAMLEFPERLADLFSVEEILDEGRPKKNW